MKRKIKRGILLFLLAAMTLTAAVPALAAGTAQPEAAALPEEAAEPAEGQIGSTMAAASDGISNDEAMTVYLNNALYFKKPASQRANASEACRSLLNNHEKKLYDALLAKITKVAAGKQASTEFTVSAEGISKHDQVRRVIEALRGDCAAELYWYDKTQGASWTLYGNRRLTIRFYVAIEYSALGYRMNSTRVNTVKGQAIQAASANAQRIVSENRGKSDTEKMRAYKNAICALNDYNYAAASDPFMPYGNPWQLVWVFDGDPSTRVVCEGYAKAFQYLCEMSSFSGSITVMSMSGVMLDPDTFSYGGRHMWNVVTMSDKNRYLVDCTWCDDGATGSDRYFLVGYDRTADTAYGKAYIYSGGAYVFDKNVNKLYKSKHTQMNPENFDPATDPTVANGGCGTDAEWALTNKGVLKIGGTGATDDYAAGQAPWSAYAGSIKKIEIGKGVTRIGNNAFAGLKKAKAVAGGKGLSTIGDGAFKGCTALTAVTLESKVKKIGAEAFSGCKKLKTVTINTTKLKKNNVGKDAFRKINSKATVICPEKKRNAYAKILKKKGLPKGATIK